MRELMLGDRTSIRILVKVSRPSRGRRNYIGEPNVSYYSWGWISQFLVSESDRCIQHHASLTMQGSFAIGYKEDSLQHNIAQFSMCF